MHQLEPFYNWREKYVPEKDRRSPFFGRTYNDAVCTNKIYNYYIHPRWDDFGSSTLYMKALYLNYDQGYAILEMMGEWNDAIHNDIMFLKRDVIEAMQEEGINKFILICENVLNFHSSDDLYYEEWADELEGGWICMINTFDHVAEEMEHIRLQHYVHFGRNFNDINWRLHKPGLLFQLLDGTIKGETKGVSRF